MLQPSHTLLIKRIVSSILFWGSVIGLLYTIAHGQGGTFLGNEPLIVSTVLWMSAVVLFSSMRVVSIRSLLPLLGVGLLLAVTTMLWVLFSYGALSDGLSGLLRAVSGILSIILIGLLISSKRQAYQKYRYVSSTSINFVGVGSVGVGTAAVCALLASVSIMKTPLTCEIVYDRFDKALESPLVPLHRSEQSLESLGEQSVFSFLSTLKSEEETTQTQEGLIEDSVGSDQSWRGSLQSTFTQAKQSLIDDTMKQRSIVTQNVCQLVLDQIDEIRKKASWNISIVVLLFVILSPIITLWLRAVACIGWIVFKILMWLGVFKIKKRLVTVSEVE